MLQEEKMNKNNAFFTFLAASVAIIVPAPARFAYGLVLLAVFNIQIIIGTLFIHIIYKTNIESLKTSLLCFVLLSVSLLSKLILDFISPMTALTLGFLIYLPAVSTSLISYFYEKSEENLLNDLKINASQSLSFSGLALIVFLLRDILGYGTITLPASQGLFEISLPFRFSNYSAASFIASIPGSFIIVSLCFAVIVFIMNKINNIERLKK